MAVVTATLQINFTREDSGAGGAIRMEIDDRPDGLNNGDTTFRPGDEVGYLMFAPGITIQQHFATAGSIVSAGAGAKVIAGDDADYIVFAQSREQSLAYPAAGGLSSSEWLGSVYDLDGNVIADPAISIVDNGATVRVPEKVTGLLKLEYNAPYVGYRLTGVPLDELRALVFAQGETS